MTEMPILYISKPKLKINFICPFCSQKYNTYDITLLHKCVKCQHQVTLTTDSYSIDAIGYYFTIAAVMLKNSDKISLRATDRYMLILTSLVDLFRRLGLNVIKEHKITDEYKKKNREIVVNEVIMEKIGAIK